MADDNTAMAESLALQQRKLAKLTDKTLQLRTRIQVQQAKVSSYRGFSASSLTSLNSLLVSLELEDLNKRENAKPEAKMKSQNQKFASKGSDSVHKGASGHNDLVSRLTGSKSRSTGHSQHLATTANYFRTQELAVSERSTLQPDTHGGRPMGPNPQFADLLQRYRQDQENLSGEEGKLQSMVDELSAVDYQLKQRHECLAQELRSKEFLPNLHRVLHDTNLKPPFSATSVSEAGTKTPTLIAEYFDEKGNAGVFRERLQEVGYLFHEGLMERALIADRGDPLDVSDEQFQESYDARRRDLEAEIEARETKAADLLARCQAAGLDIDRYRRTNPSMNSAYSRTRSTFGMEDPEDTHSDSINASARPLRPRSPVGVHDADRVDSWLRDVSAVEHEDVSPGFSDETPGGAHY